MGKAVLRDSAHRAMRHPVLELREGLGAGCCLQAVDSVRLGSPHQRH